MPVAFSAFHWQPVRSTNKIAVIGIGDCAPAGYGIPADAACPTESTARFATKARPESATHPHALPVPCHANSPEHARMEKFVATIGRRWTFMEHMELPAYRDGL